MVESLRSNLDLDVHSIEALVNMAQDHDHARFVRLAAKMREVYEASTADKLYIMGLGPDGMWTTVHEEV